MHMHMHMAMTSIPEFDEFGIKGSICGGEVNVKQKRGLRNGFGMTGEAWR